MTPKHKLLQHESAVAIADVEAMWTERRSARAVLNDLGLYWPWRGLEHTMSLCPVCRLPTDTGSDCSAVCRALSGWFTLDFATYSTARALEPLLRTFKDASQPEAWMSEFLQDLVEECRDNAPPDTVFITVPHNNDRRWQPNAIIWKRWTAHLPTCAIQRPREGRPARGLIDPIRFDVSALPNLSSVTLLDDFWTTGATLGSLALSLRNAGANHVTAVTIGRQLRPDRPASTRAYRALTARR
ncbi:hypothetical protein BN1232_05770 [Mycobacterium lentiflavum]|uniref:Amidophosphoribosyltransferase n=1 Tax=Mycobacterium lentiflavum TaxID=141349 RepID=A0A0E4H578_MYCLN|nr:hypothetical protein [Mycobacterium lentiflavum]CQD22883.1 hypothetical protein BN1232_05770 [Mycobacterium lentiflavum]